MLQNIERLMTVTLVLSGAVMVDTYKKLTGGRGTMKTKTGVKNINMGCDRHH